MMVVDFDHALSRGRHGGVVSTLPGAEVWLLLAEAGGTSLWQGLFESACKKNKCLSCCFYGLAATPPGSWVKALLGCCTLS